jgi:hypothetical protein
MRPVHGRSAPRECAGLEHGQIHRGFIGFDLGDDVALVDLFAGFFEPAGDGALLHRVAQAGHGHFGHQPVVLAR